MGARITVRSSRAARFARICGALSVPVLVLTAVGQRFLLFPEIALLPLISTGVVLALVAMACAFFALVDIWYSGDDGAGSSFLAFLYALPGVALFALALYALSAYPELNDVSTDLADPPAFALLGQASQHISLPSEDQRRLQSAAYPDIAARRYPLGIERVYEAVFNLVERRGWRIVRQTDPAETDQSAIIQVVARTPVFQFSDQVVIRISREAVGTRVDIRSASNVGRHDLGQNARRIRGLMDDLDESLQGEWSDLQSANR